MSACDENDPVPCKTEAELEAEETPRMRFDEDEERVPWAKWIMVALGVLVVLAGAIRWCFGP